MATRNSISIRISYRLLRETLWKEVVLEPRDYFWADPDEQDAVWEIDSVSQHTHSFEYLRVDASELEFVRHIAEDKNRGAKQSRFYHLWNNGESFSCFVQTSLPNEEPHRELIVANLLPFNEECSEILRFDFTSDEPQLLHNTIMHGAGGDEHTIHVHPPRS
ncbi:MAG: hypothetical protein AAGA92_12850 [Planctomycetota bacterium]